MKKYLYTILGLLIISVSSSYAQEQKTTAAVMDLTAEQGVSAGTAKALSDYLRVQLVNTQKFDIVTRENMEDILKEQQFQLLNCTSKECVVKVGQLLGVRKMFVGVITKVGVTYVVTLKIISVESGKIEKAETEKCIECKEDALLVSMENITNKIAGLSVQAGVVPQAAQPAQMKRKKTWEKDNSVMILVSSGEFLMGSSEGEGQDDEHPQHKVYLDAYYIDKYEVTNEQYAKFLKEWGKDIDENGQKMYWYRWDIDQKPYYGHNNYPVTCVTWYGATQYAKWAGKRLPTEAEWEKACRASSTTTYCFGDDDSGLGEYAWYFENSKDSIYHPVGQKKANIWGIYDMHGNVLEWCSDWFGKGYYKDSPYKNPQGPDTGIYRIIRGSSYDHAEYCRSASRRCNEPVIRWGCGFRCVISASDIPK
jgi:sulfatase modifying factor 1